METYFKIKYEFDKQEVVNHIDDQLASSSPGYICVSDGVILTMVQSNHDYRRIINESMFSICDSSWVPLYIRLIYGRKREQYCGSAIFRDIAESRKYRMFFMGTDQKTLDGLRENLVRNYNPQCSNMAFYELPFRPVDGFDYPAIADMVNKDNPDIIWVALGAPKQEQFMARLKPYLNRGVMIAVGAAFKFYSGVAERRAPKWMVDAHLEFVFRILQDPKKQIKRCWNIVRTLPIVIINEIWNRRRVL